MMCPNCNHDSPHTAGGIGVCLTPTCGCEDTRPHDPLCHYRPDIATDFGVWDRGEECRCAFIARIRKDTLSRIPECGCADCQHRQEAFAELVRLTQEMGLYE